MTTHRSLAAIDRLVDRLDARPHDPVAPEAWFLGPNAENRDLLLHLLTQAVDSHAAFRRTYAKDDPDFADARTLAGKAFRETAEALSSKLDALGDALKGSIPLSSYRNQSHMYWDVTLPSVAGYVAGMLCNQNNVAAEASPVTTAIEIVVARQLCRMLGYDPTAGPEPWGHITCDGSVANIEALWAARNLRFLPHALARAIRTRPGLAPARRITVRTPDGRRARLLDLSDIELLNLTADEAIALPRRLETAAGVDPAEVQAAIDSEGLQSIGILETYRHLHGIAPPVVMVPATAHYSWDKGAALLGLGMGSVRKIAIDLDGRMSTVALRAALDAAVEARAPVLAVVAVMGSTAESAVDPLVDILAIRDEYREMGTDFAIHADAAWGGYFASLLRASRGGEDALDAFREPNPHVRRHLSALGGADTITVDPHKSGFVPYPAGALCYRNGEVREVNRIVGDVVFHGGAAPTVGAHGIEGSKPGAAATAVWLSHDAIPPDRSGYGRLLGRCLFNARRFHAALIGMATPDQPFTLVTLRRLPSEEAGAPPPVVEAERARIREEFTGFENDDLRERLKDPDLARLFRQLGPDLTVFAYAFNFRTANGLNRDPALMNELNEAIFHACSIERNDHRDIPAQPLFLTSSTFDPGVHGTAFCDAFLARAGIVSEGSPVRFLISTMQNPWVTQTAAGNFLPKIAAELAGVVRAEVEALVRRHGLAPFLPGNT